MKSWRRPRAREGQSAPVPKQRSARRRVLAGAIGLTLAGVAVVGGLHGLREKRSHQIYQQGIEFVKTHREKGGRPPGEVKMPREPLSYSSEVVPPNKDRCVLYARLAARDLFWKAYFPADAWELARKNRSVWKMPEKWDPIHGIRKHDFGWTARPGYLLGIYNPSSTHNGAGIPYTHVAVYLGQRGEDLYIMHRVGSRNRVDNLWDFLDELSKKGPRNRQGKKAAVLEVIAPRMK